MQQKTTVIRIDPRPALQPVFHGRQGTGPREQLYENSPDQASNVQTAEPGSRVRDQDAEEHPQDEQQMQNQDAGCQD